MTRSGARTVSATRGAVTPAVTEIADPALGVTVTRFGGYRDYDAEAPTGVRYAGRVEAEVVVPRGGEPVLRLGTEDCHRQLQPSPPRRPDEGPARLPASAQRQRPPPRRPA